MRMRLLTALLAWSLFGFTGYAAAQDDDEEESDVDALMASDPEGGEDEEEEEDEEAPPADEAEKPPAPPGEQQGDEERPPGEEPVAEEPKAAPPPEPETGPANKLSLGLLIGYGITLEENANPWGFGFGARVGYNFGGFYLGGRFSVFLGNEFQEQQRGTTSSGDFRMSVAYSSVEIGPEVGYDILVGSLDIRPLLGVGITIVSLTEGATALRPAGRSSSDGQPYLAPGVSLLLSPSDSFFIGLDARLMFIFRSLEDFIGVPLMLNVGIRL
jgi:hypothetical protein